MDVLHFVKESMDNYLTFSWIFLSLLLSTKGNIWITSYTVSPNFFNITCQWTGHTTSVFFFRQTHTSAYPSVIGEHSTFYHVLQIQNAEYDCHVYSSLLVACVCTNDSAVSCSINITLAENTIDQWKCAIFLNQKMTFSNITTLTNNEPAKITTFQVDTFEGVSNVTLIENTTAMLTCIAEGNPIPKIRLIKNDTITFGEADVQSESSIKSQLNQTFTEVNRQQSGKYSCVASNRHGQSVQSLYLNILYPPSVIRMDNVYIKEGDSSNISCNYEPGNPSETAIKWTKEGIIYSNGTLLNQKVARTDAGIYTCIATNTDENGQTNFTGVDSQQFSLHVLYIPIVHRFNIEQFDDSLNVTVSENDNVVFHCVADGFPAPDMRLLKDNVKLAECNGKSQGNSTTRLRHQITSVGRQDMGQYTCVASNKIGLGGLEMFLNILIPVSRKITIQDVSNNGNEANIHVGGEATFSFSALANPLPTSDDFTWRKCSDTNICTEIANSSRFHIETFREISKLTLANITESDYGMYILQVGNGIGKPHTEVYFLKRLGNASPEQTTSVSLFGLISAGSSVVLILVVIFIGVCVQRHFRRTETIDVGFPLVVPTTSYYNDTIAQLPPVPLDLLDVQGDAIAQSSSLPANNMDVQSEIYSEIDPQLVPEILFRDDGARNETQPMAEPSRYESLDPPEQDDESQYVYGRCGR